MCWRLGGCGTGVGNVAHQAEVGVGAGSDLAARGAIGHIAVGVAGFLEAVRGRFTRCGV